MKVVLVTGVSGAGKSTIARQLVRMGRDAVSMDADERLCGWFDVEGRRVARPKEPDAAWLATHQWRWDSRRLDEIITEARRRDVDTLFLCGHAANGLDLADRFDACLLLEIDQVTMADRMRSPTRGNDFGRVGESLEASVAGHTAFLAAWRRHGSVTIDATEPIENVALDVLLSAASALYLRPPRRAE